MNLPSVSHAYRIFVTAAALALLADCGGGGGGNDAPSPTPGPATKLHYANPPATGFRLEVDPATNNTTHLVLNLMGPSNTTASGVAIFLTCDTTAATWGNPGGSDPLAKAGSALSLGFVPLFKSRQPENTGDLQVGIFQTGAAATPLGSAPIVSVALDFKVGNWMFPGTPVNLASTNGKTSMYLDGQKTEQPITLGIGTLTAQ